MGDNSNGPGCAGGCGVLLAIAIVATILKAIYDAVSSLVAAVVAAITAAVTALGLAVLGSFSAVVTLTMAWFVVFKLNPPGERSKLSGAHASLLGGTGVAAVAMHGLLLWFFGSFSPTASVLILVVNGLLALSVAFLPALVNAARAWRVRAKERDTADRKMKEADARRKREQEQARREREREAREREERDYLDVAEIREMITGIESERARLQEKAAVARELIQSNLAKIGTWSQKPGREENVAALEADNVSLEKFGELADSIEEALEVRCNAHRAQRHFLKTLRGLPKLPSFPDLATIDQGVPLGTIEDTLSSGIEAMQAALVTLEKRKANYLAEGHASTYLADYEELIDTYDSRRDDADVLLSRVRVLKLIPSEQDGAADEEQGVVIEVDDEINASLETLRTQMDRDVETLAMAELLDVSGELALLEDVKRKVQAGNESVEEIADLLGELRQSRSSVLAVATAVVEQ